MFLGELIDKQVKALLDGKKDPSGVMKLKDESRDLSLMSQFLCVEICGAKRHSIREENLPLSRIDQKKYPHPFSFLSMISKFRYFNLKDVIFRES